jgi:putative PIN family toxin of toxin-antitoxin system
LVLKFAHQGKFVIHHSPLLLDETRFALLSTRLRDSYGHGEAAVPAWCTELEEIGRLFAGPLPEIDPICRDPNDDHIISTALAVNADFIVTGDKDLLELSQYQSIRILTARAFLTELRGRDAC